MGDDLFRRRYLEVVKSRGQNHSHGRHALVINGCGAMVYPRHQPRPRPAVATGSCTATMLSTGVEGLDKMLCGGLPQGHITLVAGSAGVGKTTLALQFLATGAQEGETGLLLTFEESAQKLCQLAEGFGIDLPALEEQGKLRILHRSPLYLSVDSGWSVRRWQGT